MNQNLIPPLSFEYHGGYHDTCGDIMSTMEDVQYHGGTQITKDFPPQC